MRVVALRRFARHDGGASAVDFAIMVGPLLALLFGGIEFGRLLWTRTAIQETAITAARCMGVKQPACAPSGTYSASNTRSFAQSEASAWSVTLASADITLNNSATCSGVTGFSTVSISYSFATAVPDLLTSLAGGKTLTATACFPNQS